MCKKLIFLTSFVLVLSVVLTSVADAALPGLIGWWKLDEMAGKIAFDSSGLGNDGILGPEGDPQWVAGHFGGALDLDGNDDYVGIDAIVDDFPTDNNFSVAAWIKTTQVGDDDCIIASNSGGGHDFILGVAGGLFVEAGGANSYPPPINNNQWHHIAYVRDGTSAYAYTDGVLVGTETPGGNPSGQSRWSIGQEWDSGPSDEYDGIVDDVHFFNRPLTAAEVVQVMVGVPPGAASEPNPEDEAIDVPREVVLSWKPGEFAPPTNGHKIYLSENFNDVNDGIGGVTQSASSYAPPQRLELSTTYYWRVDEVNGAPDFTVHEGSVWSFTTELLAYPIENVTATASSQAASQGGENTVNGSGLDDSGLLHGKQGDDNMWLSDIAGAQPTWIEFEFDKAHKLHEMWVWNSNGSLEPMIGFGFKDVTIEYSVDGTDYTTLGTTHEFARAPGAPGYEHNTTIGFGGVPAKYVRLTANSNWGGILPQYGLSEVRFFFIPVNATKPYPDSGATDVARDVVLGWRAGREAVTHDVYVGTDEQAVINGTALVATVTEASYGPLSLDLDVTHYWKVNEVNEAETPSTWESYIWSFTTNDNIVVDDFESYNDLDPADPESKRIFNLWLDGYGVATNGSLVGYENPPFCEQTIVHGGKQSMPFFYSNTGGAASSEAELTLTPAQDWTEAQVQTLAVHFHGTNGNTGQLYVKINGTKVPYDGQASNLAQAGWQAWNIDLASSGAGLQNVTKLAVGIDGNGAAGTLYFDDIGLYASSREFITPSAPDDTRLIGHWKFDGDTQDSSGRGNHGTPGASAAFVAGKVGSNAIDLRGADYVVIDGVVDDITSTNITLSAWIKTTQGGEGNVFAANTSTGGHPLMFGVMGGSPFVNDGGDTQFPPPVNDDQWHLITYVRDGNTGYVYADGVLRGTYSAGFSLGSVTRWSIGQEWDTGPSDFYNGEVDDARIYDYALSEAEVAWLAGKTQPFDKPF